MDAPRTCAPLDPAINLTVGRGQRTFCCVILPAPRAQGGLDGRSGAMSRRAGTGATINSVEPQAESTQQTGESFLFRGRKRRQQFGLGLDEARDRRIDP